MIRNLKASGLAFAAIVAMGALVAADASATTFHSEVERTIHTGENESGTQDVFKAGSLEVTCKKSTFAGTSVGIGSTGNFQTTEITLHETYDECSDNVFGGGDTIDTTGCNWVIKSETNATHHLSEEIECTNGYAIRITAPGCTLSFGAQKLGGGLGVKNEGAGTSRDMTFTTTATTTFTKSGFACGLVSGTSGEYIGKLTLKGYVDNGVSGPIDETEGAAPGVDKTAVYTEGAQVGIWWD